MSASDVGLHVRRALLAVPSVQKVPVSDLEIFLLRDALSSAECSALIALIDANRMPSTLMAGDVDRAFRTSETCNLDRLNGHVTAVERKITELSGIDRKYGEVLQGQRYAVGQEFKPHHDYLRTTAAYWDAQKKIGGQRTWTFMIFLNVPEKGGETFFPLIDLVIPPRTGTLVAWNNLDFNGNPNPSSLHQGKPVISGTKYIVTMWYRERPWGVPSE